ncbi:MAG: rRNA processing protein RimM [Segetibacter sp.]|nr:rRNA processing protein RimM [Segetibacter sp.]
MNDYFSVGKIVASFGLTGEVVLEHALGEKTDLKGLEALFLEEPKGTFIPYFVESSRAKSNTETYIKLEGINTKERAQRMAPKMVWLQKADFQKFAGKSSPISMLGFNMISDKDDLGEIVEIIEQPMQVLAKIMLNGVEALIPLHQESLKKIDHKKKQVFVELPEGLLDIYR